MKHEGKNKLAKRAKRKFRSQPMAAALLSLQTEQAKGYAAMYKCAQIAVVDQMGKVTSSYCSHRYCPVCGQFRTMARAEKYAQHLPTNAHFTTLTVKNCTLDELPNVLEKMIGDIQYITDYHKRKVKDFKATRNIEITINTESQTYHPHIHLLHSPLPAQVYKKISAHRPKDRQGNKMPARSKIVWTNSIITAWLKRNPTSAMHSQDTKGLAGTSILEAMKYNLKPFKLQTDYTGKTFAAFSEEQKQRQSTFATMADAMYPIIKKRRLFSVIGIKTEKVEPDEEAIELKAMEHVEQSMQGVYAWKKHDWISDDGECLSGYIPSKADFTINKILHDENAAILLPSGNDKRPNGVMSQVRGMQGEKSQ